MWGGGGGGYFAASPKDADQGCPRVNLVVRGEGGRSDVCCVLDMPNKIYLNYTWEQYKGNCVGRQEVFSMEKILKYHHHTERESPLTTQIIIAFLFMPIYLCCCLFTVTLQNMNFLYTPN